MGLFTGLSRTDYQEVLRVVGRLLTARETAERACEARGCAYEEHLALPQKVA